MKRLFLVLIMLLIGGCGENLPVLDSFEGKNYLLLNQDSSVVGFPANIKGKIGVVGYIFTNCPDICPLTTNNMRIVQEKVKEEGIEGVFFVSLTFDPDVDRPFVLEKYAEIRGLDLNNWDFLTGDKSTIDSLMKQAGIIAVPGDSTVSAAGQKIYFYVHTDRISLIDSEGKIRKNYLGSIIDTDEIVSDIKTLTD